MNFNQLTDLQIEELLDKYKNRKTLNLTLEELAYQVGKQYGVSERTVRKWFSERLGVKEKPIVEPEHDAVLLQPPPIVEQTPDEVLQRPPPINE